MKKLFNSKIGLVVDVMMYCVILVIGYILLLFSDIGTNAQMLTYAYTSLYVLSFFFLIGYSLTKKEKKYYFLLLSLLNIIFATFIMVKYATNKYALYNLCFSCLVIAYTMYNFITDLLAMKNMNKEKLYVKVPASISLFACGIMISIIIYSKTFLSLYIMSYYFILFGLIKIIEAMLYIIIDIPYLNSKLSKRKVSKENNKKKLKIKEIKKKVPKPRKKK